MHLRTPFARSRAGNARLSLSTRALVHTRAVALSQLAISSHDDPAYLTTSRSLDLFGRGSKQRSPHLISQRSKGAVRARPARGLSAVLSNRRRALVRALDNVEPTDVPAVEVGAGEPAAGGADEVLDLGVLLAHAVVEGRVAVCHR